MGGGGGVGGGGILGPSNPDKLRDRLRKSELHAQDATFESAVAGAIGEVLADYNSRDVEGVQRVLDRVRDELSDELEGTVDLRFGGSVAKHTYIDGLSDVDALVLVDPKDVRVSSPEELRTLFAQRLRTHFGADAVEEGNIAVTLNLEGKMIQLLPAVREGEGFRIGSWEGSGWSSIRPSVFAERLTKVNQVNNGKVVPTIKLAKGIISSFPEQRRLSGYHVEAMAVEVFADYDGPKTPKDMLAHFLDSASNRVRTPIADPTGQSSHVDEYLGSVGSVQRQVAADALDRVVRKIRNANGAQSVARWRELLGGA